MRLAVAPDICRVSKSSSSANSPRGWRPLCASASARSESTRKMCFAGPLSRRERVRARACGRGLLCAANAAAASSSLIAVAGSFPSSTCRQSSRMSSSTSAWVCTKTRCAPAAAAANSSATRALRYFCCVAVTSSTSQWGRIARKLAKLLANVRRRAARLPAPFTPALLLRERGPLEGLLPSSVVSGSGQSTSTSSASAGRSQWTSSTALRSMPSISGVSFG